MRWQIQKHFLPETMTPPFSPSSLSATSTSLPEDAENLCPRGFRYYRQWVATGFITLSIVLTVNWRILVLRQPLNGGTYPPINSSASFSRPRIYRHYRWSNYRIGMRNYSTTWVVCGQSIQVPDQDACLLLLGGLRIYR